MQYTAVIKKDEDWFVGWIQEVPGVNSQGKTVPELKENLKVALRMILEVKE
jgi:predicted RNase H-like HicB family nuclease